MCLELQDVHIGQRDKSPILFSYPYLNEQKDLIFKHNDVLGFYPFVFNENRKTIELGDSKKVGIKLSEQEFDLCVEIKKNIINNINKLIKKFLNGSEKVLVFETDTDNFPFYFSSRTILENSKYSCKYQTALVYSFNTLLKSCAKDLSFCTFVEFNRVMNQMVNKNLLKNYSTIQIGDDKCYELTISQIIEML